jgi:hypothetical protein
MRFPVAVLPLLALVALAVPGVAVANTSHEGWPAITGDLLMNKQDQSRPLDARPADPAAAAPVHPRHNELLGGHGNDTIYAGDAGDVIWGDYKPGGQPTTQVDVLIGGPGNDFIYASHGKNTIVTGGGRDVVHAHYGHGSITCTSRTATIFLSHRSRRGYTLHGCTRISYKTLGY